MAEADTQIDRPSYEKVVEELLEQLNMGRGFDELFDSVYDRLHGILPYNRIAVALFDKENDLLRLISCRSDGPQHLRVGYAAHLQGSTLEPLLRNGQPRIINDLDDYLEKKPASASTKLIVKENMKSNLTLPLVAEGKPIGVVFFSSREKGAYTTQHASLLKRLAGHIAISIEKARLISQLQEQNKALVEANEIKDQFLEKLKQEVERQTVELRSSEQRNRLLVNLGRIINSSLDLKQVFRQAAEEINKLSACDRVSLILIHNHNNVRQGFGIEFEADQHWVDISSTELSGSAAEWVMHRRIPRIARSLDGKRQFPEDERLYERGYRAYAYLPLICRSECVGVLGIASREKHKVDDWDVEFFSELCDQLAVALDNASAYGEVAQLKAQLEEQNIYLRDEIKTTHDFGNIVGESRAMQDVRHAIGQVAETDSTVLIHGETGTGKELIARAIHDLSLRKDKLLVKVNCAALAPSVVTSELFGHEAGSFTGATELRHGRFEVAQDGSIFLDEIAEVPPETQVMLLRVLQERVIERVGGNKPIKVDVRVIAATNRDLKQYAEDGHFRNDLFYRLNVFPIEVPALRERREDIPSLINHFIGRFARRMDKEINRVNRRTMELLMSYDWPGNVRELENIIERAMIISHTDTLEIDATWLLDGGTVDDEADQRLVPLAEVERRAILKALEHCGGKVYGADGAAAKLGLKPTTLYGKMRKHGIEKQQAKYA